MDGIKNTKEWWVELGPDSRIMPHSTRSIKNCENFTKTIPGHLHLPSSEIFYRSRWFQRQNVLLLLNSTCTFNPFSASDVPECHKKSRRPTGDVGD